MTDDIEFVPAISIYDGAQYVQHLSLIHKPCPDMAGLKNYDPSKTERACFLISKLREKFGIKKHVRREAKPLLYTCTADGCIEPNGNVNQETNV